MQYFFYKCTKCGELYYTEKRISIKKCVLCNERFSFQKAVKMRIELNQTEAIRLLKGLKELRADNKDFDLRKGIKKLWGKSKGSSLELDDNEFKLFMKKWKKKNLL